MIADRFWDHVDLSDPDRCWIWKRKPNAKGYGQLRNPRTGRTTTAHRYAYELVVGPIPDGLTIDHLCRVRACVRPDHLEPVTNRENLLRGIKAKAAS